MKGRNIHAPSNPIWWVYRSNDLGEEPDSGPPIVVFDYQTSRAHARAVLSDWQGSLMVDDYAGYQALFAEGVTGRMCGANSLICMPQPTA